MRVGGLGVFRMTLVLCHLNNQSRVCVGSRALILPLGFEFVHPRRLDYTYLLAASFENGIVNIRPPPIFTKDNIDQSNF
jgi:hypothetical protein